MVFAQLGDDMDMDMDDDTAADLRAAGVDLTEARGGGVVHVPAHVGSGAGPAAGSGPTPVIVQNYDYAAALGYKSESTPSFLLFCLFSSFLSLFFCLWLF